MRLYRTEWIEYTWRPKVWAQHLGRRRNSKGDSKNGQKGRKQCYPDDLEAKWRKCFKKEGVISCVAEKLVTLRRGRDCPGLVEALVSTCSNVYILISHFSFTFLLWEQFLPYPCHSRSHDCKCSNPIQNSLRRKWNVLIHITEKSGVLWLQIYPDLGDPGI